MGVKKFFALLGISAKMDFAWLMRDTKFALLCIATDVIVNLSTLAGMFLIAARFGGIGGVSADEVLFMLAYNSITTGLFVVFGSGNNFHISRVIGRGQLEHMFIQPVSLPMQIATMGFNPFTSGGNLIAGIILLAVAINRLGLQISLGWLGLFGAYMLATMVILIARSYLVSTITFYAPVATEEISTKVIEEPFLITTFPLNGMPAFIQWPLLTVMPEGLLVWFPAMCLLGKPPFSLAYYPFVFAFALTLVATIIFKKGLNYYVRTGSNRYVPWGFRR